MLTVQEIGKILLRDPRATDVYSNFLLLRSMHRQGLIDCLFVTTQGRQEFLADYNIPSHYIPLGYAPHHGRPLRLDRDIDVLFLGIINVPRRKAMLRTLERRGVRVSAFGDWHDPAYWGEQRTSLLNRAKILLNFPRTAGEMSGLRFILGMANHALVVSEPVYRPAPYEPGVHFLSATMDELPDVVNRHLQDEVARRKIVNNAYQKITQNVTMEQVCMSMVELIQRTHKRK